MADSSLPLPEPQLPLLSNIELDDDDIAAAAEPSEQIMALNSDETALEIIEAPKLSGTNGEPEQVVLFDKGEPWQEHWKSMPHFSQPDCMPWKTVKVHFENCQDMEAFAKLVDQRIGLNTQFIWFPEAERGKFAHMRWIDAEPEQINEDDEVLDEGSNG